MFRSGICAAVRDDRDWPLPRRDVHFALENDGWNCMFECEVHVSALGGGVQGPSSRPVPPIPGSMAAQFVQICCKGPDRAGAPEKNR